MSYVEKRIRAFKKGEEPTFFEKLSLRHGNPVNCSVSIIAFGFYSYGLWARNFTWVAVAALLCLSGCIYCYFK